VLYLDDVLEATATYLENAGWAVSRSRARNARGHIVATRDGRQLVVDCVGETSSRPGTSRYGLPFNASQVRTHLGIAVLRCLERARAGTLGAIAVPDDERHRAETDAIAPTLQRVGIGFVRVGGDRAVTAMLPTED
jgi:hypothetical protein